MSHRPRRAKSNPRNANGHRRRQLRRRLLARDSHCALCHGPLDPHAPYRLPGHHSPRCPGPPCTGCTPNPAYPVIDEDIPVSRGGNPLDPNNTALMHYACNAWKADRTLAEALADLTQHNTAGPAAQPAQSLPNRQPTSRKIQGTRGTEGSNTW